MSGNKRGLIREKACIHCMKPIAYRRDMHDWVHVEDGTGSFIDPHCRVSEDKRRKRGETVAEPYRWPTKEWLDG